MNKPIDYPLKSSRSVSNKDTAASDMTYAILRDRVNAKKPVTDEMIRTARTKMETAHSTSKQSATTQGKFKFSKIRDRFRAN